MLLVARDVFLGNDRVDRALGDADGAVDALVGVDRQEVRAFTEAIDRADVDAVGVLAADARFEDDVGHGRARVACRRGARQRARATVTANFTVLGSLLRPGGLGRPQAVASRSACTGAAPTPTVTIVGRPECSTRRVAERRDAVLARDLVGPAGARDDERRRLGRPARRDEAARERGELLAGHVERFGVGVAAGDRARRSSSSPSSGRRCGRRRGASAAAGSRRRRPARR